MYIHILYTECPLNGNRSAWKKENKKVLHHFAIFAIVNKLLIIKYRRISLLPNASVRRDAAALRSRLLGVRRVVYYKRQ